MYIDLTINRLVDGMGFLRGAFHNDTTNAEHQPVWYSCIFSQEFHPRLSRNTRRLAMQTQKYYARILDCRTPSNILNILISERHKAGSATCSEASGFPSCQNQPTTLWPWPPPSPLSHWIVPGPGKFSVLPKPNDHRNECPSKLICKDGPAAQIQVSMPPIEIIHA